MPDEQPTPTHEPDEQTVEAGVLDRLTDPEDQRPWSVDELIRDTGARLATLDAVSNLEHIGLLHRCGDLVLPNPPPPPPQKHPPYPK
jgi:hypothetical protein